MYKRAEPRASLSLLSRASGWRSSPCRHAHPSCAQYHLLVTQDSATTNCLEVNLRKEEGPSAHRRTKAGQPDDPIALEKPAPSLGSEQGAEPPPRRIMASLRIAGLAAGCMYLLVILAFCEARPILLQDSAKDANDVIHDATPAPNVTTVITPQAVLQSSHGTTKNELAARITPRGLSGGCSGSDIKIEQGEVSGVGLPTFQVQITNSCTDTLCSISNVIVNCGLFHTGDILVNPNVFRRLDPAQGTCIVNDGRTIRNADTIIFQYKEIWKQSITFKSAQVSCLQGLEAAAMHPPAANCIRTESTCLQKPRTWRCKLPDLVKHMDTSCLVALPIVM